MSNELAPDTIAAISTPCAQGAIGIVRLSGNEALGILSKIFATKNSTDIKKAVSHTIHFGRIVDGNGSHIVDEVLASIMLAPHTYTKENIVEISCHSNPIILQNILELAIRNGARLAEPGEFTKRAFLNGRMDLSQAEAVVDIINAKSEDSISSALKQLEGELSEKIRTIQNVLKETLISLESNIDFSDDNVEVINKESLKNTLLNTKDDLLKLISSYRSGKLLKDGINVPIIGKANAGKSSLFNILIDSPSRALVTQFPGTTRDFLDESVLITGKLFKFIDTAGYKTPRGMIEKESLKKTEDCINNAEVIILLIDGSKSLPVKDIVLWRSLLLKPLIIAISKSDLAQKVKDTAIKEAFPNANIVRLSCKDKSGVPELRNALSFIVSGIYDSSTKSDLVITNLRHKNLFEKALSCIDEGISAIDTKLSAEFIATDIRHALENIQEISGERVSDNILQEIFSKFCIGK